MRRVTECSASELVHDLRLTHEYGRHAEKMARLIFDVCSGDSEAVDEYVEEARSVPNRTVWRYVRGDSAEKALAVVDHILGTHGVEGWASPDGSTGVSYANTGDPYTTTIVYARGEFYVGCWADFVESEE